MPSRTVDGGLADAMGTSRHGLAVADGLSDACFRSIMDRLGVAVFVFGGSRIAYKNDAADRLVTRLRGRYGVELAVMLGDQLTRLDLATARERGVVVALFTTDRGEPLRVHVIPLADNRVAVSVRELGADLDAFRRRYALSEREAQVAELVLHGYRNRDIAAALGITIETAKKHLSRIFDKVGVDSRVQLANRLA
jgi:DNA-binding CsgD family transcriptional regulator